MTYSDGRYSGVGFLPGLVAGLAVIVLLLPIVIIFALWQWYLARRSDYHPWVVSLIAGSVLVWVLSHYFVAFWG